MAENDSPNTGGPDPPKPTPTPNDYKNSQAFQNVITINDESINPNTGTLNFAAPLFTLKGIKSSTDLSVRVCYSQGTPGTFGLPDNWGLDLPFIVGGDEQSLTLDARVYLVDFNWESSGFKSGLRYVNTHGMSLVKSDTAQPLPSGRSGLFLYKLQNANGAIDYFDDQGKLIEHDDLYGNRVHYTYASNISSAVGKEELQLQYITDSWGQQIQFAYPNNTSMSVTLPDGSVTTVAWDGDGVRSITDPVGDATNFDFSPFGPDDKRMLSSIQYPSGVVSKFSYIGLDFLDLNDVKGQLPAISERFSYDASNNVLKHNTYGYGEGETPHTFTAAAINVKMGSGGDALMDGTSADVLDYRYDVLRTDMDESGKPIAQTRSFYNHLHLCVLQTQITLDGTGQLRETYQTATAYGQDNTPHDTNFDKALEVVSHHNTTPAGTPTFVPMEQTQSTYNEFGNVVTVNEGLYDMAQMAYVAQTTVTNQYQNTNYGTQILTLSTDKDEIAQESYITTNTLTEDTKDIATTVLTYAAGTDQPLPWKTRSFTYDAQGRILTESLAWSPNANVPQGTTASVTYTNQFSDLKDGIMTHLSIDATGNVTTTQNDVRKNTGPTVLKTLPMGETETWNHDALGRVTKHTDTLRNETTKRYSVGIAGNWEETTAPGGYITRTTFDVLGREILKQDNGDPLQPAQDLNRELQQNKYDAMSRVTQSTDTFGMATNHTYDSLNRPLTSVDALGNILSYAYDDAKLMVTQSINGDLRSIETLNGRSQIITVVKYADSGDPNALYCLREETVYDGEGRITIKTVSQDPKFADHGLTSTSLRSETVSYGPESIVLSRTATGLGQLPNIDKPDTVIRNYTYDLFGNVFTYTKSTQYAGTGRCFNHGGPQTLYDANNRLVSVTDQENGTEKWSYNANGWLDLSVRRDGSQTTYVYDSVGRDITTTYAAGTSASQVVDTAYDSSGKITTVRQGPSDTVTYEYSVDGTLTKTTFSDGKTQTYGLDKYSRTVSSTDAFSVETTYTYDQFGNVTTSSCQGDTMTYRYGTLNHTIGKVQGSALSGPNKNYRVDYAYDGFDRLQRQSVTDSDGVLFDTTYHIDVIGRLEGYTSTSESRPEAAEDRTFLYDGFNQVVSDARTANGSTYTTLYAYDGNSNIVQREDSAGSTQTMTYNGIDQRTDGGFTYDQNGRLTHDMNGLSYTFDVQDQLISVSSGSGQQHFTYHANDYLATSVGDSGQSRMYYDGDKINAMQVDHKETSSSSSLFRETNAIVANYSSGKPEAYYFDRQGSTALLTLSEPGADRILSYGTYGAVEASSPLPAQSSFGFKQEYCDQSSGLVYLRSRYYNPHIASFVSMDNYRGENRYAYCKGDPINLIDPTGHMPSWLKKTLAIGIGIAVGAAVSALTGFVLAPEIAGMEAALISGAVGGAAGNVASGFASAKFDGKSYSVEQGLIDGLTGAASGLVSAGVGEALGSSLNSMIPGRSLKYVGRGLEKGGGWLAKKAVTGAAGKAAAAVAKPVFTAEVHVAWSIGSSIKHGSRAGVAQMIASGHGSVLSPQAMTMMYSTQEDTATQIVSQQSVGDSVYKAPQLGSNSTTSSGGDSAKPGNAAFDPGFSTAHDWTPASMSDIVKKANKSFGKQWNDWDGGIVGGS